MVDVVHYACHKRQQFRGFVDREHSAAFFR